MTHPLDELSVDQLGLLGRAADVERQKLMKLNKQATDPRQQDHLDGEIDKLEHAAALLKRAEVERLRSER